MRREQDETDSPGSRVPPSDSSEVCKNIGQNKRAKYVSARKKERERGCAAAFVVSHTGSYTNESFVFGNVSVVQAENAV